jgi:hypothetical protein
MSRDDLCGRSKSFSISFENKIKPHVENDDEGTDKRPTCFT